MTTRRKTYEIKFSLYENIGYTSNDSAVEPRICGMIYLSRMG